MKKTNKPTKQFAIKISASELQKVMEDHAYTPDKTEIHLFGRKKPPHIQFTEQPLPNTNAQETTRAPANK